jgi:hypothetical protein
MTEKEVEEAIKEKWGKSVEEFAEEWNYPIDLTFNHLRFGVDPDYQGDVVWVEEDK